MEQLRVANDKLMAADAATAFAEDNTKLAQDQAHRLLEAWDAKEQEKEQEEENKLLDEFLESEEGDDSCEGAREGAHVVIDVTGYDINASDEAAEYANAGIAYKERVQDDGDDPASDESSEDGAADDAADDEEVENRADEYARLELAKGEQFVVEDDKGNTPGLSTGDEGVFPSEKGLSTSPGTSDMIEEMMDRDLDLMDVDSVNNMSPPRRVLQQVQLASAPRRRLVKVKSEAPEDNGKPMSPPSKVVRQKMKRASAPQRQKVKARQTVTVDLEVTPPAHSWHATPPTRAEQQRKRQKVKSKTALRRSVRIKKRQ